MAFGVGVVPLPHVHVLDISKDGYIKPHVDAVRVILFYCIFYYGVYEYETRLMEKILRNCMWTVALHGCETWSINRGDEKRMKAFEM